MKRAVVILAAIAGLCMGTAAGADEIEASIDAALQAYRAGDAGKAAKELDLATQLLSQSRAEAMQGFLPAPLEGWQRDEGATEAQSMTAFGGGQMISARYSRGDETVEIELMADNDMVSAMAATFASASMMGAMGEVRRVDDEIAVLTPDGELQALVDGRIMVRVTGSADAETKLGYFGAIDFDALKAF